jgi:putative serine protease PepD
MWDMENPVAPPYLNAPAGPPSSPPVDPLLGRSRSAAPHAGVGGGWAPPAPVENGPSRPGGRARFGAGVLVGAALASAAAIGGYAIGRDDEPATVADAGSTVVVRPAGSETTAIGDIVDAARPSVVAVRQQVEQSGPFGGSGQAAGTGFVLSSDGYIVTNNHVIAEGDTPVVTFADGTTEDATIVAGDPSRDLAVLKVARTDLVPLAVGDSDDLRLGDPLVAVGYALDLNGEPSVTAGILSAKNRTITEENGAQLVNLLQTDTAINPGNSGGPLLNNRGEVVGINTAIAGQAQNIGFAIAITPVMDVIDELRAGNVPDRALMGVTTQPTGEGLGVEIIEIAPDSGAADSSLEIGDVIVEVDGTEITDPTSLGSAIATYQPGDTVEVTIERDGTTREVPVTLGTRPT